MGRSGGRSNLYIVCAALFPLAFAAFVVGFGCPVWITTSDINTGLWQSCFTVFENCTTLDFADTEWMAGVRGVEIFAVVMLSIALVEIIYENACTTFRSRTLGERLATGGFCILTGLPGLAGVVVYVVKMDDVVTGNVDYGWAFALLAGGSGLLVIIGAGFLVHGLFLEKKRKKDKDPSRGMNGRPYTVPHDDNYELPAYSNRAYAADHMTRAGVGGGSSVLATRDNLPGIAVYNGPLTRPGDRRSLPGLAGGTGPSMFADQPYGYSTAAHVLPPFHNPKYSPPPAQKMQQYYSISDDRILDPSFDLSEGYVPVRRSYRPAENPYAYRGHQEDPYSARPSNIPRREDPYSRGSRYDGTNLPRPFTRDSPYVGAPF